MVKSYKTMRLWTDAYPTTHVCMYKLLVRSVFDFKFSSGQSKYGSIVNHISSILCFLERFFISFILCWSSFLLCVWFPSLRPLVSLDHSIVHKIPQSRCIFGWDCFVYFAVLFLLHRSGGWAVRLCEWWHAPIFSFKSCVWLLATFDAHEKREKEREGGRDRYNSYLWHCVLSHVHFKDFSPR